MSKPQKSEYNEFYETYVGKVPDGNILQTLADSLEETIRLLAGLSAEQETFAYEAGKWTVREVVGHMVDTERLFGFRALWMARGDQQPQPGMDQNDWNTASNANDRSLEDLLEELSLVRKGHILLFRSFGDREWSRSGTASGFPITVRALPYIMAGHEIHHRQILAERYLKSI